MSIEMRNNDMKLTNAEAVEKYEKENAELIAPDFFLRVKAGPFGSVHPYPVSITNVAGGFSGYEWDTGSNWVDNEGSHLRVPLRTYVLEKWTAYKFVTIVGLVIHWREYTWECDNIKHPLEPGEGIVISYHMSSDEESK